MTQQPLHLREIDGGRDVQGDHLEALDALTANPELLKGVDHTLRCGSRTAVAQHDEANGAVLRTPHHLAGPSGALVVGLGGHDVPASDAPDEPRTNQGTFSSRTVPSSWSTAHRLSTDTGGQSSSTSSRKCTLTLTPSGFVMVPSMDGPAVPIRRPEDLNGQEEAMNAEIEKELDWRYGSVDASCALVGREFFQSLGPPQVRFPHRSPIASQSVRNFRTEKPREAAPRKVAPPAPNDASWVAPITQRAAVPSIAATSAPRMMTTAQRPRSDRSRLDNLYQSPLRSNKMAAPAGCIPCVTGLMLSGEKCLVKDDDLPLLCRQNLLCWSQSPFGCSPSPYCCNVSATVVEPIERPLTPVTPVTPISLFLQQEGETGVDRRAAL